MSKRRVWFGIGKCSESGWSLLELSFVLLIIGFILGLTVPSFTKLSFSREVKYTLNMIADDFELARTQAVSQMIRIKVKLNKISGRIEYEDENSGASLRYTELPRNYRLCSNFPNEEFVFGETGQGQGGTFTLFWHKQEVGKIKMQVATRRLKIDFLL